MNTGTNKSLSLAFIIVVILFLLFCGGAITMTMSNATRMNGIGIMSNISWMWIPAMLTLLLTILLGWTIFLKKSN